MQDETPEYQNVKFNAGFFQIQRIHEVQRMINISKINPMSFNKDYNIWNFQLWLNCLNALLDEVWSKLSSDEKVKGREVRKDFISRLMKIEIIRNKYNPQTGKMMTVTDEGKWPEYFNGMVIFDNYVRDLMDLHGWNNPNGEEDDDPY